MKLEWKVQVTQLPTSNWCNLTKLAILGRGRYWYFLHTNKHISWKIRKCRTTFLFVASPISILHLKTPSPCFFWSLNMTRRWNISPSRWNPSPLYSDYECIMTRVDLRANTVNKWNQIAFLACCVNKPSIYSSHPWRPSSLRESALRCDVMWCDVRDDQDL